MSERVPTQAVGPDQPGTGERRFLTFQAHGRLYALPGTDVSEVILVPPVARLPHSPGCLMGLANLRGAVIPVVDLRALLGRGTSILTPTARGIVVTGSSPIAIVVDRVDSLVTVENGQIETGQAELAAESGERLLGAFQAGAEGDVARILDLPALLSAAFGDRSRPVARQLAPVAAAGRGALAPAIADDIRLLISFAVADQDYALPLESVREIVPFPNTLSIQPQAEAVLLGVTSYRDRLLPLLSLRGLLGFAAAPASAQAGKVIVVPVGDALIGLVADQVRAIIRANVNTIDTAPSMLAARTGGETKISAIHRGDGGRHLVSVLAPDHLFREDVMRRLDTHSGQSARIATAPAERTETAMVQVVVFRLGSEEFALPIHAVDEVARVPAQVTRVPKTPKFIEGVINSRGQVLPVIDQRRRFDLPESDAGNRRRLMVVRTERHRAGLIVDSVSEVLRFPSGSIEPAPDLANGPAREGGELINGVINVPATNRMILLLDPAELLTRAERGVLDELELEADAAEAPTPAGS